MRGSRGITLIDTLVGVAIMAITFIGIAGVFRLSVDVVTNNKARTTATALASQRLEYAHSIAYSSLGMQHGIPSGIIPETEIVLFNGINFTRKTFIEYDDDPADGVGASDTNGISEDYKMVKVDVSWNIHGSVRHVILATRVSPPALETNVLGGVLSLVVTNATGVALPGITVSVINNSLSPTINETLLTDASGTAMILGAPTSTAYQIIVTNPGYSTAQTYAASSQNTSPTPGNLTVTNDGTTAATFAIDILGTKIINTWTQILSAAWSDSFANSNLLASMASTTVSGGSLTLSGSAATGTAMSVAFGTTTIASWGTITISQTTPAGTGILYRVYNSAGTTLVPDSQLPGNSAGFATTTISLSGVSTSSYPLLTLGATLSTINASKPSVDSWAASYMYGPLPLGNIGMSIRGNKSIGTGPGGTVYKYSGNATTSAAGTVTINGLEWDSHTISILTSSGYDAASVCSPQPEALAPGGSLTTNIYLTGHTTNTLLVDVHLQSTGAALAGAQVNLTRSGTNMWAVTDSCGQAFFGGLTSAANYTLATGVGGHATTTTINVNVSGQSRVSPVVN
ncbi:MAG: hypothetical protein JWO50_453 [Candidatus Kaiserbacteria bacterium]|nr:hypothetical protein [Candidatus Kaiserbacteria bacterium]